MDADWVQRWIVDAREQITTATKLQGNGGLEARAQGARILTRMHGGKLTDGEATAVGVGAASLLVGPFVVGTVYDATGHWTTPLWLLMVLVLPLLAVGAYAGRPAYLEDQLGRSATPS